MPVVGADIEQLRNAATQLTSGADSLEQSVKMLNQLIISGTHWRGPDADRFRTEWTSLSTHMVARAVEALRRGADDLRRNAEQQNQASGVGGAGTAGTPSTDTGGSNDEGKQQPSAGGAKNAGAADAFVDKWEGKFIDPDKSYGAQCFDVFRQYSNEVVGADPGIAHTSDAAADIYNHYDHNGVAPYYDRIPAGQGTPQPGDMIVYGGDRYNAGYGHVALITEVNGNNYSVLEQNYG